MNNMVIGVVGKSGSGKTVVANEIARRLGCDCIDIDKVGHLVNEIGAVKRKYIKAFGQTVVVDGVVDRDVLGGIVFSNPKKMKKLYEISWPYMEKIVKKAIKRSKRNIVLDYALLPQTNLWKKCDKKILIDADFSVRSERLKKRDKISIEKIMLRENASIDYSATKFDIVAANSHVTPSQIVDFIMSQL